MREPKRARQQKLLACLKENPLLTDEELAEILAVSVSTVRLDRLELGIPELRVRAREAAARYYGQVRSLGEGELVGELLELAVGRWGVSLLEARPEMVFARTKILRGHYLFAQANSLAVALVDAPVALTGSAAVRFLRPVFVHQQVVARAEVVARRGDTYFVAVRSRAGEHEVLRGRFVVVAKEWRDFEDRG